jgi:hypothetical protein
MAEETKAAGRRKNGLCLLHLSCFAGAEQSIALPGALIPLMMLLLRMMVSMSRS